MIWRVVIPAVIALGLSSAWGGEIIFVDPIQEKAKNLPPAVDARSRTQQSLEQTLEGARERAGRGRVTETIYLNEAGNNAAVPPSSERSRTARDYLDDNARPPPTIILRSEPPPTDSAKSRQTARSWVSPASSSSTSGRCKTENIAGGIEGATKGNTVIQSSQEGVTICK